MNCHTENLFPVLQEQIEAAIRDAFAMNLLYNSSIISEQDTALSKGTEETIRENKADPKIGPYTRQMVKSNSFAKKITQRISKEDSFLNSFASHANLHVNNTMHDWWDTTNLWQTFLKLSNRLEEVAKTSGQRSRTHAEIPPICSSQSQSSFHDSEYHEHCGLHSLNSSDRMSERDFYNEWQRLFRKTRRKELHLRLSMRLSHSYHSN